MKRILVIEDGAEYSDTFGRFLADRYVFTRAGSGPEALAALRSASFDAVFLDMRFDRIPPSQLLGDADQLADERFDGDVVAARRHLEDQQGLFVLAALREAGCWLPVLISHDFGGEGRRLERLVAVQGPLDAMPDVLRPQDVVERLERLLAGARVGSDPQPR